MTKYDSAFFYGGKIVKRNKVIDFVSLSAADVETYALLIFVGYTLNKIKTFQWKIFYKWNQC